jgi:hypothetical protein
VTELRQRQEPIRSSKVLNSARGQPCAARFPGICNGNPETTVFAHLNGAAFGKGAAVKAHDILGFHACYSCHTYYDTGHGTRPLISTETLLECVLRGVTETWVRLIRAGIIVVPLDAPKPFHERKPKARKPPEARKAIPARVNPWPKGRKIPSRKSERTDAT